MRFASKEDLTITIETGGRAISTISYRISVMEVAVSKRRLVGEVALEQRAPLADQSGLPVQVFVEDGQRDGLHGGGHLGAGGQDDVGPGRHEVEPVRLLLVADVVRGHQALGADEHRHERGRTELRGRFFL